jgi:prenyltransferase beta subunit
VKAALDFINSNLASALVAAVVLAVAGAVWKWWRDRRDRKKIYEFMIGSRSSTGFAFRTTQAISSHTRIPEKRVAELCGKHPKIRRNEKEKQSWTLVE